MYWIYVTIFTIIVFVPTFINHGFLTLSLVQTQEYVILFLGLIAYSLFSLSERYGKKMDKERIKIQKEANRLSRDLTHSYSYIGEINRKLDILRRIILQYPVMESFASENNNKKIYSSVLEAVSILTKTKNVAIIITNKKGEILHNINNGKKFFAQIDTKQICGENKTFCNTGKHFFISSTADRGAFASIIIQKKSAIANEDIEMLKALASHALFLYSLSERKILKKDKLLLY